MARSGYYIKGRVAGYLKIAARLEIEKYSTLTEKYCKLSAMVDHEKIAGGPANEVLRLGGERNLIWADIDTWDWDSITHWLDSSACPLVMGSFRCVPSATGKCHIYIVVDRELKNSECFGMFEYLMKSMAEFDGLPEAFDRVYGPDFPLPIYLPKNKDNDLVLPQQIVADLPAITRIPTNLLCVRYNQWASKKRLLINELRASV